MTVRLQLLERLMHQELCQRDSSSDLQGRCARYSEARPLPVSDTQQPPLPAHLHTGNLNWTGSTNLSRQHHAEAAAHAHLAAHQSTAACHTHRGRDCMHMFDWVWRQKLYRMWCPAQACCQGLSSRSRGCPPAWPPTHYYSPAGCCQRCGHAPEPLQQAWAHRRGVSRLQTSPDPTRTGRPADNLLLSCSSEGEGCSSASRSDRVA